MLRVPSCHGQSATRERAQADTSCLADDSSVATLADLLRGSCAEG